MYNKFPAISVVMPMYNAEKYLENSLDSVLNQLFSDFELIIIDDGSTDDSVDIIDTYADNRIQLIRGEHNFINSLNLGLSCSKGKYIARMDADDIMMPNRLKTQFVFMENHPEIGICGSWAEYFGIKQKRCTLATEHKDIVNKLLFGNMLIHPSVMFRKEIIQNFNLKYSHDYPHAEDYKLWVECVKKGLRFANIPEILLKYRTSETQISLIHYEQMMQSTTKIKLEYVEYVKNLIATKHTDLNIFKQDSETPYNDSDMKTLSELYAKELSTI